jgi:hypothetical protein
MKEQSELSEHLQSVVLKNQTDSVEDLSSSAEMDTLDKPTKSSGTGVPILRRILPVE